MKKRDKRGKPSPSGPLFLLGAAFLLGGVLGSSLAQHLPPTDTVTGFLQSTVQGVAAPTLSRTLWCLLRWPAAAVILGWLPLAGLTLPLLFLARGCALSYGITAVMTGGESGAWWAGVLFGSTCLLAVPALFLLGTRSLVKKRPTKERNWSPGWTAAAVLALALCAGWEQQGAPRLAAYLAQRLSG